MTNKKRNLIIILASLLILLAVCALLVTLIINKAEQDAKIIEKTDYNEDGSIHLISYRNNKGELLKHTNYDYSVDPATGEITVTVYYYDGANTEDDVLYKYEKTVFDYNDNPLSYVQKEDNVVTKEIAYTYYNDGVLWIMTEKTYDDEGEHAIKTVYNEDGSVKSHTKYLNDVEVKE